MYMNRQPNVNTWKCHNPRWRVLGEFFARGGENIPSYCKISRTVDVIGLLATRASVLCGALILEDQDGSRKDVAAGGWGG